jgi:glycosyltransferase involved in cell wall biosynthesis
MPFNETQIKLSILILSIPSRFDALTTLFKKIESQIKIPGSVEILCLVDNKSKHIADKRNDLLLSAQGKFLCYLDDDDDISDDYIDSLLSAIESNSNVDIITFNQKCTINGEDMKVYFGMGHPTQQLYRNSDKTLGDILRPPFHMCVWKSDIAKSEKFERIYSFDGQSCEDYNWTSKLYPKIKTELKIDKFLHHYIYNSKTTESIIK